MNGPRRWVEQRWLVDSAIRTEGVEWDQPRIGFTLRPAGIEGNFDFAEAKSHIQKFSDITRVFRGLAERREARARAAEDCGHLVTARDHYFLAALLYVSAEWPFFEDTQVLKDLEDRKNRCYGCWARLAPHPVERVDIPFNGKTLPAWFHLPPNSAGRRVPLILACGGMDAFKEINVAMYGDKLLERGFAVLAFDGPGQGEAIVNGIQVTEDNWVAAGQALMDWALTRTEIDPERIMGFGISFGSFWMTQIAATQPKMCGCVVSMVCHEPGARTLLERASPTFKARFMWMSGIEDEAAFDRFAQRLDLRPLVAKMIVPWLVIAGEEDDLSPIEHTYHLASLAKGPVSLLVYEGERHSLQALDAKFGGSASSSGPNWYTSAADWLLDRAQGKPLSEFFHYITSAGTPRDRQHPKASAAAGGGGRG